jgi:hypothetical protein
MFFHLLPHQTSTKRPVDGASPFPGNAHQGAGDSKNPQAEMPCPMEKKHMIEVTNGLWQK